MGKYSGTGRGKGNRVHSFMFICYTNILKFYEKYTLEGTAVHQVTQDLCSLFLKKTENIFASCGICKCHQAPRFTAKLGRIVMELQCILPCQIPNQPRPRNCLIASSATDRCFWKADVHMGLLQGVKQTAQSCSLYWVGWSEWRALALAANNYQCPVCL